MATPTKNITDPTTGVSFVMRVTSSTDLQVRCPPISALMQPRNVLNTIPLAVCLQIIPSMDAAPYQDIRKPMASASSQLFYRDGIRRPIRGQIWPRTR